MSPRIVDGFRVAADLPFPPSVTSDAGGGTNKNFDSKLSNLLNDISRVHAHLIPGREFEVHGHCPHSNVVLSLSPVGINIFSIFSSNRTHS
jgi:hypothetical protein